MAYPKLDIINVHGHRYESGPFNPLYQTSTLSAPVFVFFYVRITQNKYRYIASIFK